MKPMLPIYAAAALALSASTALATDTALYPEAPPADASFVRFAGFGEDASAVFAGKTFDLKSEERLAYIPVSSAALEGVDPGAYITVARDGDGGQKAIAEDPRAAASKVSLFLVNATHKRLELKLADGSVTVIDTVEPMSSGLRAVNPVAISLGVFGEDGDAPLATYEVSLHRGQNLTFLAEPSGVRLVENRFGAVAK
ncbi:MAG: alginate O-acetyltransferase AlgF [Pseudomonadota bacterium]